MIRCTTHNLQGFRTGVYLTHGQFIGIGMSINGNQPGNNDGVAPFSNALHTIYFQSGHGKTVRQFIRI